MFTAVSKLKFRLSHIKSDSWHWKIVDSIWSSRAKGSACSYYWIKLPVALLATLCVVLLITFLIACRVLTVGVAWIFGYRFIRKLTDTDAGVTYGYNYSDYKEKRDGTYMRFAPWQYLLIPLAGIIIWFFAFKEPQAGLTILIGLGILILVSILVYLLTKGWKNPYIQKARRNVYNAWHRICPTLDVEYVSGNEGE